MTIRFAKFIKGETIQKVRAIDIPSTLEYEETYRNNLFCSEDGCNAKIELAHRSNYPYFRTWRFSKHSPDCYYYFENDPQKRPQIDGEVVFTLITNKHKKAALKHADRKRQEEQGKIEKRSPKNKTTDRNQMPISRTRVVGVLDPFAIDNLEEGKTTRIPSRSCDEISQKDIGKPITVRGEVSKALVEEDSVIFYFDTQKGNVVRVLFFNMFRNSSEQAYRWIVKIGTYVNRGNRISVSCIGICDDLKDDNFSFQLRDSESLSINGKSLFTFVNETNLDSVIDKS